VKNMLMERDARGGEADEVGICTMASAGLCAESSSILAYGRRSPA
jgi:hypothetical protein